MNDITHELKNFMENKGYTQESLAQQLGVSQARIQQLLSGKKPFGKKAARQWHELFGINESFLLTGKGDVSTESVTIHQIGGNNTMNNANDPNTIEAILRLTKMLEQERAEKEEWKRKYFDVINNKVKKSHPHIPCEWLPKANNNSLNQHYVTHESVSSFVHKGSQKI